MSWERTKKDAKAKHDLLSGKSEREKKAVGILIGGYESSDDEKEGEDDEADADDAGPPGASPPPPPPDHELPPLPEEGHSALSSLNDQAHLDSAETAHPLGEEAERQRIRRLKAEEWKRKRAEAKS